MSTEWKKLRKEFEENKMSQCEYCGNPGAPTGWGTYDENGEHVSLILCDACTANLDEIAKIVNKEDQLPTQVSKEVRTK